MSRTVVVIGGGIVGSAAAHFLSAAGENVVLLDAVSPSSGATGASDGAVSVASKRPGPMMTLAREAREFYVRLAHDGLLHGLYHRRSTFILAKTDIESALLSEHEADLKRAGEDCRMVEARELSDRIPGIGAVVSQALEIPGDGHAIGYQVVDRFIRQSTVTLRRNSPVVAIERKAGGLFCALANGSHIDADSVILAAGVDSGALLNLGDVLLPRKGQIIITDRAVRDRSAVDGHLLGAAYLATKRGLAASSHVALAIDPLMTGQFLIGGSRENNRRERLTDANTVSSILREALDFYPPLVKRRVIRTFSGTRAASVDGLPIVGRHPHIENVFVATGFEGDGICLGPYIGHAVAGMVLGRSGLPDLSALNPARFVEQRSLCTG